MKSLNISTQYRNVTYRLGNPRQSDFDIELHEATYERFLQIQEQYDELQKTLYEVYKAVEAELNE